MGIERPNEAASTGDFEFAALSEARNYRAALIQEFAPYLKGKVIEVGAGIGQITAGLERLPDLECLTSIEPDPRFCRAFRAGLPDKKLIEGTISDLGAGASCNAVLSINVLEHIHDDETELAKYWNFLAPAQGLLCLFVPARPEIYAPIDKDFGHHRRYTRAELSRKLINTGFNIVRLHYFNCIGYFAWWLNFCVLRKRGFNVNAVRCFDRFIFPPVHWCESKLLRPPFGQSLLAVASARLP
jgi:SAM-dependent methyltransferase